MFSDVAKAFKESVRAIKTYWNTPTKENKTKMISSCKNTLKVTARTAQKIAQKAKEAPGKFVRKLRGGRSGKSGGRQI